MWPFQRDALAPLVEKARGGDERAFTAVYDALYPRVWGYVARRVRARADAEDLVARTFHRLLERLDTFEPDRGTVCAFVLSISRNLIIDEGRARRATTPLEDAPEAALVDPHTPLIQALAAERSRALQGALEALDADTRELLVLRFADGLRHAEIAVILGTTETVVKQRCSPALRALQGDLLKIDVKGGVVT